MRLLNSRIDDYISIRLKDGTKYNGKLKEYDNFMNLILEDVEEIILEESTAKYEELFIRGNNVLFIEPVMK